jgi:hypothetical protein
MFWRGMSEVARYLLVLRDCDKHEQRDSSEVAFPT